MAVKLYRHPDTGEIKQADPSNDTQAAALKKLGFVEFSAEDIENDAGLGVTYEQVTKATPAIEPPALPKLTTPIQPGPTRDTSPTAPPNPTPGVITREDVEGKKK